MALCAYIFDTSQNREGEGSLGKRMRKGAENEPGIRLWEKAAHTLELPAAMLANVAHMELHGNTQVLVEGGGNILEYNPETIRVKTGKMVTRFCGRGLQIKCLSEDALLVEGFLTGIEFLP